MTRASIRFSNRAYNFATVRLPDGMPTRPQLVTETLSAPGVDGIMTINMQYAFFPFRVLGIISAATLASAETMADELMGMRGVFAKTFETSVLGRAINFQDIQMQEISAIPRRDIGGGPFSVSSQGAIVEVSMVLRPTKGAQR